MITIPLVVVQNKIDLTGRDISIDDMVKYMKHVGIIKQNDFNTDLVDAAEDWESCVDSMLKPLAIGDVGLEFKSGLFLVTDTKPEVAGDGKHYRGLKIHMNSEGFYLIDVKHRSRILNNNMTVKLRKSKFDMESVERCIYGRYLASTEIQKFEEELSDMKG